jgi:hypothetical protein
MLFHRVISGPWSVTWIHRVYFDVSALGPIEWQLVNIAISMLFGAILLATLDTVKRVGKSDMCAIRDASLPNNAGIILFRLPCNFESSMSHTRNLACQMLPLCLKD